MMKSATSPCFLLAFCILFFAPPFSDPFVSGASSKCSGPAQGLQGGSPVFRIYGPCSQVHSEKSFADSAQIHSLNTLAPNRYRTDLNKRNSTPISGEGRSLGAGNFVVKVGFGTPTRTFNLVLDTGSDETWIKCKSSDKNQDATFNPSVSSTFSKCSHNCSQTISYFDRTYAKGNWAFDTLSIPNSVSFPKFRFICADRSKGFEAVGGLLGLGQGNYSLVSQTSTASEKAFCYCLPGDQSSTGYVFFGSRARQACQFTSFTPLLSSSQYTTNYFVNLVGISVGNKTLDVSYATSSYPGAMLDSGTVITRLPKSTYKQLRETFKHLMMSYPIVSPPSDEQVLDTCYNLEGFQNDTMKIPNVVLHFENVDVKLDKSQLLWKEDGKSSRYCLAFGVNKEDDSNIIIGNHQQQKLNVLYDIQNSKVGIQAGNCGN